MTKCSIVHHIRSEIVHIQHLQVFLERFFDLIFLDFCLFSIIASLLGVESKRHLVKQTGKVDQLILCFSRYIRAFRLIAQKRGLLFNEHLTPFQIAQIVFDGGTKLQGLWRKVPICNHLTGLQGTLFIAQLL